MRPRRDCQPWQQAVPVLDCEGNHKKQLSSLPVFVDLSAPAIPGAFHIQTAEFTLLALDD